MDDTNFLSQEEQRLFNAAKEEESASSEDNGFRMKTTVDEFMKEAREKYQAAGISLYTITVNLTEDDDTEVDMTFLFRRPSTGSYDRYIKTVSTSMSKASKAFVLDNIIEEQRVILKETLENYPALAISVSGKLLSMLGMADSVAVKKV